MGCERLVMLMFGPNIFRRDAGRVCFIGSCYHVGNLDFMRILPDYGP